MSIKKPKRTMIALYLCFLSIGLQSQEVDQLNSTQVASETENGFVFDIENFLGLNRVFGNQAVVSREQLHRDVSMSDETDSLSHSVEFLSKNVPHTFVDAVAVEEPIGLGMQNSSAEKEDFTEETVYTPGDISIPPLQGITEPSKDSLISATVSGRLHKIYMQEGRVVKRGDVILELESTPERLEVARRKLVALSKVELDTAEARMETSKLDLEATRKLYKNTGSISKEEMMEKELEFKIAKAEYENFKISEERESIEYEIAQAELEKRIIRAPFDGVVAKIYFQEGENCSPQEPLVRVVNTEVCRFVGYVNVLASSGLKQGVAVSVFAENTPDQVYSGYVEHISPVIDPSSGLQELKVVFPNEKASVCPGVNATVSLSNGKR